MGEFIYSLTQMCKSWKHALWVRLNNKAGLNHLATYLHSPETGNQSPSTKHPENILQALKNFTIFFKHSTTWAPKATVKELQQKAPFLLFCKDWAMEGVFNCHGTTGFLCQQHMPLPTPPPHCPKKPLLHQKENLKAGRFCLSDFMIKIHLEKGICLDDIKWKQHHTVRKLKLVLIGGLTRI